MTKSSEGGDGNDRQIPSEKKGGSENLNPDRKVLAIDLKNARETNDNIMESVRELPALTPGMTLEEAQKQQAQMDAFGIDYGDYVETASGVQEKSGAASKVAAEDYGTVIDYPWKETGDQEFSLGMDHEQTVENRDPIEKLHDFVKAAATRVGDSDGWQKYLDGEVQKFVGIGEGLNIAKEHTKESVAIGWKALTDGTVASFLAKPNAINEPLFKAVGNTIVAMTQDPNSVNHAFERLGNAVLAVSEKYGSLPSREKGHVIGETAFFLVNPEGSTKTGEMALKATETIATQVDLTVIEGLRASVRAAEQLSASTPELAARSRQLLYQEIQKLGLTPHERELAGIPSGFFDGIEPAGIKGNDCFAMSTADDVEGKGFSGRKIRDTGDGGKYQIDEVTGRFQRTDLGKVRSPYRWPVINEQFADNAIRQSFDDSCLSAAGEMVSNGQVTEKELLDRIGRPSSVKDLADALGERWTSESGPTTMHELHQGGPWVAHLRDWAWTGNPKPPHAVVIDGQSATGNLLIRDPLEGTSYEMKFSDFREAWTGHAAYRKLD
ncbi:MAG: hypothetical protein SGJ27_26290 [Candidatus Melainabacteria bacterium]|nr:hypothetical protein [Candidatus Melainabacteria bacterium]